MMEADVEIVTEDLSQSGSQAPINILIHGPSGHGKTLLAGGAADGDNRQANIEDMIETCLAAWNADDIKAMAPHFSNQMASYGDRYTKYKEKYGNYTAASKKASR